MFQNPISILKQFSIGWLIATSAFAAPPDLTQPGVIAGINRSETYNLGATGLRGWIAISSNGGGDTGLITDQSRQILVTHCVAPANAVLAVDDVILGAMAASSGTVPDFASDCRKSFATAIGDAEKTGAGTLRVKRWRAGDITDQNIPITILGNYSNTAPFTCPKSALILNNVRNKMVADLLADPNYLSGGYGGGSNGLALLAGVKLGDPDYAAVQTRLQTFARDQASRSLVSEGIIIWDWSYMLIFLSEYYLLTNDAQVVPGILNFTLALSESQSYYGTYGHEVCVVRDASGRRTSKFYGPVNAVGGTAIIAMILGKKALVAAGQSIAPEIDAAINRSANFFAFYKNKGSVPYGEHEPAASSHASNGKDAMPAIFFSLLPGRAAETEYFSRLSIAGWIGREYGHTGQGLSYYWTTLGALMGGPDAASEHLKQVRWHLDLSRRTDGSFAYDGREQFGPGTTTGNTYLGEANYGGMSANAMYLLTYSMPHKRLWITGKNANPAHTLDSTKIANAVAAGSCRLVVGTKTVPELFAALGEYDPAVRFFSSKELATRSLSGSDLTNLRDLLTSPDANLRQSACQVLGILQDATALPTIVGMLNDSDIWVRNKAAQALRSYQFTQAQADAHLGSMMNSFINNATDPNVIDWNDPIQTSNGNLSQALFGDGVLGNGYNVAQYTINANKPNPLYEAIRVGLRQPDSYPRMGVIRFAQARLSVADIQALYPEIADTVKYEPPADRMWGPACRGEAISFMTAMKMTEGIPLALALLEERGYGSGAGDFHTQALNGIASYGDAARYTLPILKSYLNNPSTALVNAIATIENSIAAPAQNPGLCVANPQVVTTTGAIAITLSGVSPRGGAISFLNVTQPAHGTLSGTAPNFTYTPTPGYTGPDQFTFQTSDALTTSTIATVGIVVGPSGNGISGEYFNNANFTNSVLTRTDPQINFDWASTSPHASISPDTFSTRWSGALLIPESALYTFSALTSDGVRLYLNGQMIIDRFADQNTRWTDSAPISLAAGQMVDITMEYYEKTGNAVAKLKWTGPGFAGRNGNFIPQTYLFEGLANRPCYAFGQNLSTTRNSALPLTLAGSGGTLSYHILSPPANGTLSGMAPNLTYTPNNNFAGTDSFTFLVNNGISNSQPATISISVENGALNSYVWASAADGNWNDPARWTPSAPAAAGQANYALHFSPTGTYTATHNLNNGFQLNQLHFSGSTTLSGTQSIAFSGNGGSLPRLVQNSTATVIINTPLSLQSTVSLTGYSGGQVTLAGIVSGAGGIIKDSPGTLRISQNYNTYSGGTTLNMGRIIMPSGPGGISSALGTGPITLNSGTILALDRSRLTNAINLNGVTIENGNSFDSILSGPVTLNNITLIDSYGGFEISGPISGSGGISSIHWSGEWRMSGSNTYTGPTKIEVGSIKYASAASVAPGPLVIISPGKANLDFTGNRVIASLTLGGVTMSPGTYGASNQAAYFTGAGTVTVLPPSTCSLNLTTGSSPATPGTALTFTATVTGNAPTGNVSFYAGNSLLGTSALNGAFQASFTTSSLAIGTHGITARYVGNANNASSTSTALAIEIASNLPTTPTNLIALPNNNQVRLLWTASPGATSYRVKRSLTNGGPYTEIATPAAASYIDTSVTNGTTYYYVVASTNAFGNSGDSSQVSAMPALQPSTTSLSSSATSATQGAEVTFTALVAVAGIPPTGTVVFKNGGTTIGSSPLSSGMAFFTTSSLPVAGHIITAEYSGDANYSASVSSPCSYQVLGPVTTTGTTVIDLGTRVADGGSYFVNGILYSKIPTGTLPPRSILRGVAWNVTLTKGEPYLGDLTVFFADSDGSNPVLQVGGVGPYVDGSVAYPAPIQLPWNAGPNYAIGTTVSTSLTAANGVPAFDLNNKTTFLQTTYPGGWGGEITLTHDTPGPVPVKPLNLQATPGNNQVSLTWSAAAGATNYFIKRSLYAEGPFTVIGSAASTSFTDTTGVHGSTYYYVVSGINADGESLHSDSVSASYSGTAYTVSYNLNSATSGTAPSNQSKNHGANLTLAYNVGNLARTDYVFVGWNTQANGAGTDYAVGAIYSVNANVTLFSKWAPSSYAVTYDANSANTGTIPASQTKAYAVNLTLQSNSGILARAGYTFSGWNTQANGLGTDYAAGATYAANAAVTLFAKWTPNSYTVTFDKQSGSGGSDSVTAAFASAMPSANAPTRAGYTFGGYYAAANGSGTQYYTAIMASAANWNTADNAILYAHWIINSYTITFDSAGGSAVTAITQNFGTTVSAPANPTLTGYTFTGWSPALPSTMPSNNQTVIAQWTASSYTVTFDKQNGNGGSNSITATFGGAMPIANAPTRAGYTFGGYYTAVSGGGTQYYTAAMASAANWSIAGNTTLFAQWINNAPTWTGNPITAPSATEGSSYSATLVGSASDVDVGASLTFAKVSGKAWLNVAANGVMSGTPASGDGGVNTFTISVSDGIAPAVQTTLHITVNFPAFTWDTDAAGNWSDITNWLGNTAYASGINAIATLDNVITANRSITLDANRTIGSIVAADGTHDYTISGANILTLDRTGGAIPVLHVTPAGRALTIGSVIDGNDGLDKWGVGQLNLNGSAVNSFTGGVKVSSGTLNLNFANLATPTDLVNNGNSLTLGGGTLLITGNSATNTNQTLGNVTVNSGGGQILVNPNNASRTATLTLGSMTPAATGTLIIGKSSGATGTATITTTSDKDATGIYGGRIVFFNGTANTGYDFATTSTGSSPFTLSAYSAYSTLPTNTGSSSTNYKMAVLTTLDGNLAANTLKMEAPAGNLALGSNLLTIHSGGLLFTGTTARDITGTAGATRLTAGNSGGSYDLIVHKHSSANLNISAVIGDNGSNPVALVVQNATIPAPLATTGFLALNGINTFTGGIYLNNAAISVPNPGAGTGGYYGLNNNNIYVSGYSLISNANSTKDTSTEIFSGAITLNDGAVLEFRNNTRTFQTSGAVTGNGGITLGQVGGGATTLHFTSTTNTFTGPIRYAVTAQSGNLTVNSLADATSFGAGDITFGSGNSTVPHNFTYGSSAIAPLTLNNRRFELTGTGTQNPTINNNSFQTFTINTDLLSTGTGTKTLTLGGTGSGWNTFAGTITNGSLTTLGLTKADTSTWSLTNTANSYNGITTITAGTLQVSALAHGGNNSSIGASTNAAANLVFGAPSATLRYTGSFPVLIDRGFTMSSGAGGGATIESSGTGTLSFDNTVAIAYGTPSQTRLLTLGGTHAGDNTFGKVIANNTSATSLTKAGTGTWVLTQANTYTGVTTVSEGKLFVNGDQTSANGAVNVAASATLGGTGIIGGNTTIAGNGKLEFNLSTAPGGHDQFDLASGCSLTFSGASTLTITSSGPATPGTYTLITAPSGITGVVPSTVILPPGWTADAPTISGNSLLLNVTATGPNYTVTYDGNSETSGTAPSNQTKNHNVNLALATNSGTLVRTGFTFAGWNTQADGLGADYAVASTYTTNANVTLFAKWIMTFDGWSGGSSFIADTNGDGTKDGMAWLLGAANKDAKATSQLPVASSSAGNLQVSFTCLKIANRGSATLKLQVSDDLGVNDPWTGQEVVVPDSSGTFSGVVFTISANADPTLINVQASIPNGAGGKLFARLMGAL